MPSNAANPALGTLQNPLMVDSINLTVIVCDCAKSVTHDKVKNIPVDDWVQCCILGIKRQKCVEEKITDEQASGKGTEVHTPAGANYDSTNLPEGKNFCRPDIVVGPGPKPVAAPDISKIYELKFPCNKGGDPLPSIKDWSPDKLMGGTMRECYEQAHLKGGAKKKKAIKVEAIGPTAESCT